MLKPTIKPDLGPRSAGMNKRIASALQVSSIMGAPTAMSAISVWMEFHDEGTNPGVSRELARNAGKALSIPATNQPSA